MTNPFEAMQAAMLAGHKNQEQARSLSDQELIEKLINKLEWVMAQLEEIDAKSGIEYEDMTALRIRVLFDNLQTFHKEL